jgi:hypothetical protein
LFSYAPVSSGEFTERIVTEKKQFEFAVRGRDRLALR